MQCHLTCMMTFPQRFSPMHVGISLHPCAHARELFCASFCRVRQVACVEPPLYVRDYEAHTLCSRRVPKLGV